MGEKDFSEIARLSERYNKDPKSRIFVQLADAYRKNNMIDEALEILNKGLAFNPTYPLAHLILGKCYFDKRMYEQAKEAFNKTLTHDPQNIVALRMLAQTCETTKDENGQLEAYKGILSIDPFDAQAKEKLTYLESLHKKEPLYTVAMAEEYEKQGDIEKALSIYENLSFTDPSDLVLKEKVAQLKEKTKKEEKEITEEKIEGLQLDTYFQPEELDKKEEPAPEPISPASTEIEPESVQAHEPVAQTTPSQPFEKSDKEQSDISQDKPEISEPAEPDLLEPIENTEKPGSDIQESTETAASDAQDLLQPLEDTEQSINQVPHEPAPPEPAPPESKSPEPTPPEPAPPESKSPEPTPPEPTPPEPAQKAELGEDLLQPFEKSEESDIPKLLDIEETEAKPEQTTVSDQPDISADLLKPVEEQGSELEPEIQETKDIPVTPPPPAEPVDQGTDKTAVQPGEDIEKITPSETEPKPQVEKPKEEKPQEEDFQSFKDWLGGLLK
jgi:tetratricopeptide (TPR) repeat protein